MIDVEAGRTYTASAHVQDINAENWGSGGGAGATATQPSTAPMLLDVKAWRSGDPSNKVAWLPGAAGNYIEIPDVNLLDTRQASFDNVGFSGTVNPEDRYEVWGSGGGTGAGTPGATSPMLIDLEALRPNLSDNPNAWTFTSSAGTTTTTSDVVDSTSPTGRSTRIERTAADAAWAVFRNDYGGANVVIEAGDEVRVGFWVKRGPNDGTTGQLYMRMSTSSSTNIITPSDLYFTAPTGTWQWFESTFVATRTAQADNIVYVAMYHAANIDATIDYYFAGALVEKVVRRALWLPGASGNYTSAPGNPALDITGDIDLRAMVALKDWSNGSQHFIGKWHSSAATNQAYRFRANSTGTLQLYWQEGATMRSATSTVAVAFPDRGVGHVRVTLDVDNGAATPVYEVKFYTSADGLTWTQLGSTVVGAAVTSIQAVPARPLEVGSVNDGTAEVSRGVVLRAQVRDGIDGAIVYDEDFTDARWAGVDKATHANALPAKHSTFTRSSTAHLDGVEVASGTPRYPHGRNLLTAAASSFEDGTTGQWGAGDPRNNFGASGVTIANSDLIAQAHHGTRSLAVTTGTTAQTIKPIATGPLIPYLPGTTVTVSMWVRASAACTLAPSVWWSDAQVGYGYGYLKGADVAVPANEWVRLVYAGVVPRNTSNNPAIAIGPALQGVTTTTAYTVHLDAVQIEVGSAATPFRPGGPSAVLVEEETTNLAPANVANGTEDGTTGSWSATSGATLTSDTVSPWQGTRCLKVVTNGAGSFEGALAGFAHATHGTFTASAHLRGAGTVSVWLRASYSDGTITEGTYNTVTLDGPWRRFVAPAVVTDTAKTLSSLTLFIRTNGAQAVTFYVDGAQVEAKAYATSWAPGGSSRGIENLHTADGSVPNVTTIEAIVGPHTLPASSGWPHYLLPTVVGGRSTEVVAYPAGHVNAGRIYLQAQGSSVSALVSAVGAWDTTKTNHIAVTVSGMTMRFFVNGVEAGAGTDLTNAATTANPQRLRPWASQRPNAPFQAVRISDRVRTTAELTQAATDLLLTVDEGTTYLNTFDGDLTGEWGATTTINRSGEAEAAIVDRTVWAMNGSDYLTIPDRAELDLISGAWAMAYTTQSISVRRNPLHKKYWAEFSFTHESDGRLNFYHGDNTTSGSYTAWSVTGGVTPLNARQRAHVIVNRDAATKSWSSYINGNGPYTNTYTTPVPAASTDPVQIGTGYAGGLPGFYEYVALFRRPLTSAEATALNNWDGKVATEPVWLRPLSVFYVNADDPLVRASYENNEVLNLGTAVYGELGWNITRLSHANGDAVLKRNNTVTPTVGSTVLELNILAPASGGGSTDVFIESDPVGPVTPGQTYSASIDGKTVATSSYKASRAELVWYDSANGEIGRSGQTAATNLDDEQWRRLSVSGVAPTGAAKVSLEVEVENCDSSWSIYFDAAIIRQGADTGYVPSLRVREDWDLRFQGAAKDWTSGAYQTFFSSNPGSAGGLDFLVNPTGEGYTRWGSGGSHKGVKLNAVLPLTDRAPAYVRLTLDVDNGANASVASGYVSSDGVSWTAAGTGSVVGTGAVDVGNKTMRLGEAYIGGYPFLGAGMSYQIRDGIDGPVLLDLDIANWPDGSDTYTMPNGLTATIKRAGDAVAEILDQNILAAADKTSVALTRRRALDVAREELTYIVSTRPGTAVPSASDRYILAAYAGGNGFRSYRHAANGYNYVFMRNAVTSVAATYQGGSSTLIGARQWGLHGYRFVRQDDSSVEIEFVNANGTWGSTATFATDVATNADEGGLRYIGNENIRWMLAIRGRLTDAQLAELAAWNGLLSTEPTWLRSTATFYWNPNDDHAKTQYLTNNLVVNLASVKGRARTDVEWRDGSNNLVLVDDPTPDYRSVILKDGPVGYWRLGETSGTVANAEVGADATWRDGSGAVAAPTYTAGLLSSDDNGAVSLAKSTPRYASVPTAGLADTGNAITAEAWFKPDALPDGTNPNPAFIAEEYPSGTSVRFVLGFDSNVGKIRAGFFDGAWHTVASTTAAVVGTTEHWVGTYDGTTVRLYRNGVLDATLAYTGTLPAPGSGSEWRIGRRWDAGDYLDGVLDEVTLYNKVLTADQVKRHYEAGKAKLRAAYGTSLALDKGAWVRPYVTAVAPAGATKARVRILAEDAIAGQEFYTDAALFEATSVLKSYFDANFASDDYIWKGTANASPSLYYANRNVKTSRLQNVLPEYLPPDRDLTIRYDQDI